MTTPEPAERPTPAEDQKADRQKRCQWVRCVSELYPRASRHAAAYFEIADNIWAAFKDQTDHFRVTHISVVAKGDSWPAPAVRLVGDYVARGCDEYDFRKKLKIAAGREIEYAWSRELIRVNLEYPWMEVPPFDSLIARAESPPEPRVPVVLIGSVDELDAMLNPPPRPRKHETQNELIARLRAEGVPEWRLPGMMPEWEAPEFDPQSYPHGVPWTHRDNGRPD